MAAERFRYDGKRVLVVGGASGMGAATAQAAAALGAEVVVMDVAEVKYPVRQAIRVDLRDRASVDAAIAQVAAPIHALFCCAGVADGTRGLMLINFIAQRHIVDTLLERGVLGAGAAIAMISSVAGMGWEKNVPALLQFLELGDWQAQADWIAANPQSESYAFSKQLINCFIARQAMALACRGMRINGILPGPTDTPLARANADVWLSFGAGYREAIGRGPMTSEEMADALLFLCSDAARGISGITLLIDAGHISSAFTGSWQDPMLAQLFA